MADWKSVLAALGATEVPNDNIEKTYIDLSDMYDDYIYRLKELTKPSGCALH